MTAESGSQGRRWGIVAAVVAVVLVLGGGSAVALNFLQGAPAAPAPSQTVPTSPAASSSASDSPTPVESQTPSESPTPSPTPTLTPTAKPDAAALAAYCAAAKGLRGGSADAGMAKEDGGVDFARLSKTFGGLQAKYQAAAKLAPKQLKPHFERVLFYLQQGKKAADSQDLGLIQEMVASLSALNDSMDAIDTTTQGLCR